VITKNELKALREILGVVNDAMKEEVLTQTTTAKNNQKAIIL
jgi:hypothetical protein